MLFNSIHYLLFFPFVAALFFCLPVRLRAIWLVLASCYFYMVFRPAYIVILLAVISRNAAFTWRDFANDDHLNGDGAERFGRLLSSVVFPG